MKIKKKASSHLTLLFSYASEYPCGTTKRGITGLSKSPSRSGVSESPSATSVRESNKSCVSDDRAIPMPPISSLGLGSDPSDK